MVHCFSTPPTLKRSMEPESIGFQNTHLPVNSKRDRHHGAVNLAVNHLFNFCSSLDETPPLRRSELNALLRLTPDGRPRPPVKEAMLLAITNGEVVDLKRLMMFAWYHWLVLIAPCCCYSHFKRSRNTISCS